MALDPVPWFIGGGAKHSAAIARNLAWNATSGATGIATPTSLQVRQLPTAGGAVQIMPGGAVIESTYPGALQQSYTIRNSSATTVTIPGNTSSGTVTRYVWLEVNDPEYEGSVPANRAEGPYVFFRVTTNFIFVDSHPRILLAAIVQPPSTTTVTSQMIKDRRVLARPRREEYILARPRVSADTADQIYLTARESNGGEWFPGGGGFNNGADLAIPSWANSMIVEADWMSLTVVGGKRSWGSFWIEYGDEYRAKGWPGSMGNKHDYEFATQAFGWDTDEQSATYRTNWRLMDTKSIPKKLRGKTCEFRFKAGITNNTGAVTSAVKADAYAGLGMRLTFLEVPADWQDFN